MSDDRVSQLGRYILDSCPRAYVNERGEVIDPCHVYWTLTEDPTNWSGPSPDNMLKFPNPLDF